MDRMKLRPDDKLAEDKFWRFTEKRGPNECWPFTKYLWKGFGRVYITRTKSVQAQTFSWELHKGPTLGKPVSHLCGNLNCVNPAHLTIVKGHGHGTHKSKVYYAWRSMNDRCYCKTDLNYKNYGGRGIYVCEEWRKNFPRFLSDMGEPKPGLSIERINNDGPYSPANCRWATPAEQSRNTRRNRFITFGGRTLCLADWAKETGIKYHTISSRIRSGWTVRQALTVRP